MRVLVVGAGLMGAQIGCEYALGGHDVSLTARNPGAIEERVEAALARCEELGLYPPERGADARTKLDPPADPPAAGWDLVVESVPEDFDLKVELLRPLAA